MIFCRYCGAGIADDSLFCAKCGKKLGRTINPRVEKIIKTLRLRTPYPYAGLLILLVVVVGTWAARRDEPAPVDYSSLRLSFESERRMDLPDDKLYQQGFSLILQNDGTSAVSEIPVDFGVKIEPQQPAEIEGTFQGQKLLLMRHGKALPLTVTLADEVPPGKKHTFSVEGTIQAQAPFKVTYEIRERDSQDLLASYVVER